MGGPYNAEVLDEVQSRLNGLLEQWAIDPRANVALLRISENATFLAKEPIGDHQIILRVHRPGYHSQQEIASELAWISALRTTGVVRVPAPLPMVDGAEISALDLGGEVRYVVAFEFLPGKELDPGDGDLAQGFETLGAISARLHAHARTWSPPAGFVRKTWDFNSAFGPDPLWGDWRAALGLTADGREILERLARVLRQRLDDYGRDQDRFGLIHSDLRLANLLADGKDLSVIDFDDCGFSWFMYDFAAAISFLETEDYVPDLQEAWVKGYRRVGHLGDEHIAMLPTFVMFRRLLLTAWIATHAETETASSAGLGAYTEGTIALAEAHLAQHT